jgi:hypothetical protein
MLAFAVFDDKGDNGVKIEMSERESGFFEGFAADAVFGGFVFEKTAADTDPFVVVHVVLFLDTVHHQIASVPFDVA